MSEPIDTEYIADDQRFRTMTSILKAFRGEAIPLFTRTRPNIANTVKMAAVKCHKVAFLLVRAGEVVAAMPVQLEAGEYTVVLANNTFDAIPNPENEPLLACANPRKIDSATREGQNTRFLPLIWVQRPTTEINDILYDYMSQNWLKKTSWEEHVGMYQSLLHQSQTRRNEIKYSKYFIHYFFISNHLKNKKRLLSSSRNGVSYFSLLQNIGTGDVQSFPTSSRPYAGDEYRLSSYLSSEDLTEIHSIRPFISNSLPENEKQKFNNLLIFRQDLSQLDQRKKREVIQEILENFLHVLLAVLRCARDAYDIVLPTRSASTSAADPPTDSSASTKSAPSVPTPAALRKFASHLCEISHFFYILHLSRSKILQWVLNVWLIGTLEDGFRKLRFSASLPPAGDQEEEDEDCELGDEDADNIDSVEAKFAAEKISLYLRLSFATYRYAREISWVDNIRVGRMAILSVGCTDKTAEDWKDTVRFVYKQFGQNEDTFANEEYIEEGETDADNWEERCRSVIEQIEFLSRSGDTATRNWLKFARQSKQANQGACHCEAILAALFLLWRVLELPPDPILRRVLPIVGPSKPCCPLCAIIIEEVNRELRRNKHKAQIPILYTHSTPCATALPPGLPSRVRKAILKRVGKKVFTTLEDFRMTKRSGSHGSEQSETLTQPRLLQEEGVIRRVGTFED